MNIFKGKTVLITGHTGFKGSWLCCWLNHLGANIIGISNDTVGSISNYSVSSISDFIEEYRKDICDTEKVAQIIKKSQPDFVFHLAAQALVRTSYENPIKTMKTNAIGTANVLDALKVLDKKVVAIMITSDKVYDNVEWAWGYRETDRIGGKDPYSASKGMAELVIRSYVESFFNSQNSNVRIGITRAGNVIGGGDWATDRIVPDCIKAWSKNQIVDIRNPNSTRPWQHVLEPLSGYLKLAQNLDHGNKYHGQAYNFGPSSEQNFPVSVLIGEMSKYWRKVKWNDVSTDTCQVHEAGLLNLNCDKALFDLNWRSVLKFEETVKMTVEWYKYYYQSKSKSMYDFSIEQIKNYSNLSKSRNIE